MTPSERYRQVAELFLSVCDLAAEERCRELSSLCGADAELLAEVQALLAYHDPQRPLRESFDRMLRGDPPAARS